ncbi:MULTISPECIES: 50S ribosomal protein L23 [Ligilactobacillus]|uniref:Large ribosomal subunit protein uL23 n=2 Tax=Ligilactobacillus TaxID=2767887 RepID=A0A0R1ZJP5_9LACO|nr:MULTISPECIES: 50S ribosomal protein L23 [Ligilactobacillus]KRM53092.1 50S ribosomal protein L23 [Ligilactobacillus araffinosus DSM 20653]OAP97871.1 50S ribosomal protein L23 [Ligilactobacillus aviarius]OAP98012.1 50S ribosomal protein L23 [Ligilactobacillus aviarius]OAP98990.1 50S ribosomal protein L23 [Ligilactobacillus aviarius]OAQ03560.1 50S ribosomal protein L23 [Ligilactobacillus aviarius]
MESRDVILRPVITEASMADMDDKRYTFDVDTRATKTQVKSAVEDIFDVKVAKVNIMNVKGKKKRMGRYEGYTKKRRKAIVTLTSDSKEIKLFDEE